MEHLHVGRRALAILVVVSRSKGDFENSNTQMAEKGGV